jgi:hypothetical protein
MNRITALFILFNILSFICGIGITLIFYWIKEDYRRIHKSVKETKQ